MIADPDKVGRRRPQVTSQAQERARDFLAALFMGLRTAQIHDPSNEAFENAVRTVHRAALELFDSSGGFRVQFVEDAVFLNGARLRFQGGAYASMRTLRTILESREMGGVELKQRPSSQNIRDLVCLFSPQGEKEVDKEVSDQIGLLGVQRFSDDANRVEVDRRVYAVQVYAKLILALREQFERRAARRGLARSRPPRLRAVRLIQDLIDLANDRSDFLLHLAMNQTGASGLELLGTNSCLHAVVLGNTLGLTRPDLVDVGISALFHLIGVPLSHEDEVVGVTLADIDASVARFLAESGQNRSAYVRAMIIAEQRDILRRAGPAAKPEQSHLFSRIVALAVAYQSYVSGYPRRARMVPIDALLKLQRDGRFDQRLVDTLVNILRAFPRGTSVVLDSGALASVNEQPKERWDRPVVMDPELQDVDLMERVDNRFVGRISATARYLGRDDQALQLSKEVKTAEEKPSLLSATALTELPVEEAALLRTAVEDTSAEETAVEESVEESTAVEEPLLLSSTALVEITDEVREEISVIEVETVQGDKDEELDSASSLLVKQAIAEEDRTETQGQDVYEEPPLPRVTSRRKSKRHDQEETVITSEEGTRREEATEMATQIGDPTVTQLTDVPQIDFGNSSRKADPRSKTVAISEEGETKVVPPESSED